MTFSSERCTLPTSRLGRWLASLNQEVPEEISVLLLTGLFTSWLPVLLAAAANILVNVAAYCRHPSPAFALLLIAEAGLLAWRLPIFITAKRSMKHGLKTPTDVMLITGGLWSAIVGVGTAMCVASGDPILQFLAPTTMMGIVVGIATRNHVTPRLAILQLALCDVPLQTVLFFAGNAWWLISVVQCPMFIMSLTRTVYRLHNDHIALISAQKDSERRATHDALTGLLNRSGLMDALARGLRDTLAQKAAFALLYMDLDGFKGVNDAFGHAAGDALLRQVGERITVMLPDDSCPARLGGDEFVVLLPRRTVFEARQIAKSVIAAMSLAFDIGPNVCATIGASVGIAYAAPGTTPERLLAEADAALYRAKLAGKGRFVDMDDQRHEPRRRQLAS